MPPTSSWPILLKTPPAHRAGLVHAVLLRSCDARCRCCLPAVPGVIAMGLSVRSFRLPWLDKWRCVHPTDHRGTCTRAYFAMFLVCFVVLGYPGVNSTDVWGKVPATIEHARYHRDRGLGGSCLHGRLLCLLPDAPGTPGRQDQAETGLGRHKSHQPSGEITTMKLRTLATLALVDCPTVAAPARVGPTSGTL